MCLSAVSAVVADRRLITENVDPVDAADAAKLPRLSAVYQPTTTAADEDDDESLIDSTSDTVMSSLSAVSADYASTGLHTTVTSSPLQNAESAPSASMYVFMYVCVEHLCSRRPYSLTITWWHYGNVSLCSGEQNRTVF